MDYETNRNDDMKLMVWTQIPLGVLLCTKPKADHTNTDPF
jgi:hypothetical protein